MVLEIGLTRLYSVLLFYHSVFLVLAVALLGLGLGGALISFIPDRERRASEYCAGAGMLAALGALATALVSVRLMPAGASLAHGAVALVPFLCVGMAMPLLFTAAPQITARLYGADLVGAAVGAVLVIGLLFLGALPAVLGAAMLFAAAAVVVGGRPGERGRIALLVAIALVFGLSATTRSLDVDLGRLAAGKPLGQLLDSGRASVVRTTWDPFGRVDVVRTSDSPLDRYVFLDGAAGSPLPRYPSDSAQEAKRLLELGAFPYRLSDAERALVIGSGGGRGVLYALLGGVEDITAVEVSGGVIDAVRADGEYAGFLYDRPGVTVIAGEGRSFLDRDDGRYDVIDLSLVVSLASAQGGYALAENYLFTQEAFASVFAHLDDDGLAAVRLYDDPTLTRAFVTAVAALREIAGGEAAAVRHLAVVFNPDEADGPAAFYPMLLISKRPLTEAAARELTARAASLGHTVMFAPDVREDGPFGRLARGEVSLAALQDDLAGGVFDPPTDDRPFFFEMREGLPDQVIDAWIAVAAIVALAAMGIGAVARARGATVATVRQHGLPMLYFAALGLAFILVEVALLARLTPLLGHPTVAVTVVLAGLLLASGAGSIVSGRLAGGPLRLMIPVSAVVAAGLAVAVPLALNRVGDEVGAWAIEGRVAVVLIALAPLGVAMGTLFPSGLRLAGGDVAAAWAVNGVASVVGAVLATTIALEIGYPAVSLAGAALYGALAIGGLALLRQSAPMPSRWAPGLSGRAPTIGSAPGSES